MTEIDLKAVSYFISVLIEICYRAKENMSKKDIVVSEVKRR